NFISIHFSFFFFQAEDGIRDHALYKAGEKQPIPGAGLNQPMLWTTQFGKGRVFVDALGHDAEAMKMPGFVATLARGAEWAATGRGEEGRGGEGGRAGG